MRQAEMPIRSSISADVSSSDSACLAAWQRAHAEWAFNAIVERHGAMVFRTCNRLLGNIQEAEDAAQAVFVVLATQGQAARSPLAIWLHDRARDSARVVLHSRIRRHRREAKAADAMRQHHMNRSDTSDLREELDAAISRLPAPLREALVLRYLEGYEVDSSARMAGCSQRTFARYCNEGLERLREILARGGAVTSSAALIALLTQEAAAKVSSSTLIALKATLAGSAKTGAVAHGLLKTMLWAKAKLALTIALVCVAVPVGIVSVRSMLASPPSPPAPVETLAAVVPVKPVSPVTLAPVAPEKLSSDAPEFVTLRDLIKPSATEYKWARIPWLTDLWSARRASVEQHKPIFLFDCWGHPLGETSNEGLLARAHILNDPAVQKTIAENFIPCACDDWYETRRRDEEGRFFRLFSRKGGETSSQLYCIAPDGKLLSSLALEADAGETRTQLAAAIDAYRGLSPESLAPKIADAASVDFNFQRPIPTGAVVLRVFGRALERDAAGNLVRASRGIDPEYREPGRDNMWLNDLEWRALLVKNLRPGDTFPMPPVILRRLCRFHIDDHTRGAFQLAAR